MAFTKSNLQEMRNARLLVLALCSGFYVISRITSTFYFVLTVSLICIMETVKCLPAHFQNRISFNVKNRTAKIISYQPSFSLFPAAQNLLWNDWTKNSFNTFLQYSLHIKIPKSKNGNGWILLEPSTSLGKTISRLRKCAILTPASVKNCALSCLQMPHVALGPNTHHLYWLNLRRLSNSTHVAHRTARKFSADYRYWRHISKGVTDKAPRRGIRLQALYGLWLRWLSRTGTPWSNHAHAAFEFWFQATRRKARVIMSKLQLRC